jgi:hypothetical protein
MAGHILCAPTNLFIDGHIIYNEQKQLCRYWFPEAIAFFMSS